MLNMDLAGGICDSCGTDMSLMDYYNQDGVCIKCFEKWMDEIENEKQEMIGCTKIIKENRL